MAIIVGILMIVIGLISCFVGKPYFRFIMGLQGFIVGFYASLRFLAAQGETVAIVGGVIIGIILGLLFYQFLYKWAIWVFGALLGIVIAGVLEAAFGLDGTIALVLLIVGAIVGVLVGNALSDLIIRISTAFSGAAQTVGGLAVLSAAVGVVLPLADPTSGVVSTDSTTGIVTIIAVLVLGVIGFLYQGRYT